MRKRILFVALSVLAVAIMTQGIVLAASQISAGTLPNGTPIQVTIDSPATGDEFVIPAGDTTVDVTVNGTAAVGQGEPDATLVYVLDLSASTLNPSGGNCGGDRDGDGNPNTILDCQIAFVLALNNAAVGSVDEVGVVVYGEGGAAADMTPGGGDDPITMPDANGDVATVVTSVFTSNTIPCPAGIGDFTAKNVGCDGTNFAAGLQAALTVVNASTNSTNIVVFMSDGTSNQGAGAFPGALSNLAATGAEIDSIAVGTASSCTGGTSGTLQQMADDTGGQCQTVVNPANLPDIIPALINSTLDSLDIEVDGGGASPIPNADITPPLPVVGPAAVNYSTLVTGLGPGDHEICVTANGTDAGGSGDSGPACVTIHVLQVDLAITKTASPTPAVAGTQLTYTLQVTNNGDADATGVMVTDTLPPEVNYVSAAGCTFDGAVTVTCNLGGLAETDPPAVVTIVVDVPPSVADGAILTNMAQVEGNESDPDLTNNSVTLETEVIRLADLTISKTDDPDPVGVGEDLTYTIEVVNNGPSNASGVMITDTLPAQVDFVSASSGCAETAPGSGVVVCGVGDLDVGDSATVTIVVTASCDAVGGITNEVEVAGNETDPDLSNNTDSEDTEVLADFGDADDPPYPTKLASGGAYHCNFGHEWLGASVDGEPDAKFPDNFDDGVFPKAWYETGELATLPILVSTSGEGVARYGTDPARRIYVEGWIDFDKDGAWSASERVFTCNIAPYTHGTCNGFSADWLNFLDAQAFNVRFNVPKGILPPGQTWMRVRLSYGGPVGPTGPAEFGEVEDYQVSIFRGADP